MLPLLLGFPSNLSIYGVALEQAGDWLLLLGDWEVGEKQKKKPSVGREERTWYQASRVAEGLLASEVEIDSLGCVSREKGAQLLLAECLGH